MLPLFMLVNFTLNPLAGDQFVLSNNTVPDHELGLLVRPHAWGHDAEGFRNATVPDRVDIVAIGDSQTWGLNALRKEAWPHVLGELMTMSVYNMGMIRFGPMEYYVLTERALEQFSPKIIIIGLYFGNDLYDAYVSIYTRDVFADLRRPDADPDWVTDTIGPAANEIFSQSDAAYSGNGVDTQFTAAYRSMVVDGSKPRIAEGLRSTSELLLDLHQKVHDSGARLVVLLIPTKELVYADLMAGQSSAAYVQQIRFEEDARSRIVDLLDANGIEYVDSLPALREAVQSGIAIYPRDTDGHPVPEGYRIIADTVASYLKHPSSPENVDKETGSP
jgi:lysophospholipase L1-like esterase